MASTKHRKDKTAKSGAGSTAKARPGAIAEIHQRLTGKGIKTTTRKGRRGKAPRPAARTTPRPASGAGRTGRLSALDAAAKVLADSAKPMRVGEVVKAMEAKGLWKSKAGKTPQATVYASIIREIAAKGKESRFVKKDRGLFAVAGK